MLKEKKLIAICANANMIGGVEEALVQLLRNIDYTRYSVDLYGSVNDFYASRIPNEVLIKESYVSPNEIIDNLFRHRRFGELFCYLLNHLICVLMYHLKKTDIQAFYSVKNYQYYPCITEKKYDLVVAYTYLVSSVVGDALSRLNGRKKVLWVHGYHDCSKGYSKNIDKVIYRKFDKVFCCSNSVRDTYKQKYPISGTTAQTFYNIADSERICSLAEEEIAIKMQEASIVTVGRLSQEKGQKSIPTTVRLLLDAGHSVHWYLVGEGPMRKTLEKEIEKYQVSEHVILLGAQRNPYPYVKKAKIYVQTSLSEGWCLTTQEAKILCKPIVTTNLPVMKEQFINGTNGIITKDKSPQSLFEGIQYLLDHPNTMESFSSALKNESHDNSGEVEKLYELIDS